MLGWIVRDVFVYNGVKYVVFFEGVNDFGIVVEGDLVKIGDCFI